MRFFAAAALLAGFAFFSNNGVQSQEKKEPKTKGSLPQGWSRLDLTADQKSAIYKVQTKFKEEIKKLKEKEEELKSEERREMVKLLTADQKKRLEEIATGEKSKDEVKKDDGKKDAPKDGAKSK